MGDSLREKTVRGIGWSAIERFSVQGVSFIVQIVLARLLVPSDYGVITILAVFLQLAQVFIDSGFANALIKKTDCTQEDYATVFWYNLGVALILYLLLFVSAPVVSSFYDNSILAPVLRVISLTLIINALSIVQRTRFVKSVDFKSQSKVTLTSSFLSGIIGILLAYWGVGVWALVFQQISNSAFQFLLYLRLSRWMPKLLWSSSSFKYVFGFGSKLLAASLIGVIYKNLYSIVIGKRFSAQELGYFSRADQFATFPSNNIGNIVSRVSFPVFSPLQNDNEQLLKAYRKLIRFSSYIIFPLMFGLIAVSEPLIITVLTDKWANCIIILRILCLDWSLDHISLLNLNLLYVKGKTDLVLKLEIIKKTIAVLILFASIPLGLIGMCWGRVLYSIIATVINTYYTKKLLGLGFFSQFEDFFPSMAVSAVMASVVYYSINLTNNALIQLVFGCFCGVVVYIVLSLLFLRTEWRGVVSIVKNRFINER